MKVPIMEVSSIWRFQLGRFPFYGGPLARHDYDPDFRASNTWSLKGGVSKKGPHTIH